jgi:hypothetical protein
MSDVVRWGWLFGVSQSAADDDSNSDDDLLPFERVVKRDAYRRALEFDAQIEKYEKTEDRLVAITGEFVHRTPLLVAAAVGGCPRGWGSQPLSVQCICPTMLCPTLPPLGGGSRVLGVRSNEAMGQEHQYGV